MQQQMGNISPDMMRQAQAMAANMKPEDWEAAKKQVNDMDPNTLQQKMSEAQGQMHARTQYIVTVSLLAQCY